MSKHSVDILRFEFQRRDTPNRWLGIYQAPSGDWKCKYHDIGNGCPGPAQDRGLRQSLRLRTGYTCYRHLHFGFTSVQALKKWFWKEEVIRIMDPYCLAYRDHSAYRACLTIIHGVMKDDVYTSKYQSCFKWHEFYAVSRLTSIQTIMEYLKEPRLEISTSTVEGWLN